MVPFCWISKEPMCDMPRIPKVIVLFDNARTSERDFLHGVLERVLTIMEDQYHVTTVLRAFVLTGWQSITVRALAFLSSRAFPQSGQTFPMQILSILSASASQILTLPDGTGGLGFERRIARFEEKKILFHTHRSV